MIVRLFFNLKREMFSLEIFNPRLEMNAKMCIIREKEMTMKKRVFLIVADSLGIGALPDARMYGDEGSNTLKALYDSGALRVPTLTRLGLFSIAGNEYANVSFDALGCFARMKEASIGKDTTIGHWELAGIVSHRSMPTYPNGFPKEILSEFEKRTGRGILCNKPASGTQVILDFAQEQKKTGKWIVYTSADSVFQIAAHEEVIPLEELYSACEIAREILVGEHAVGRVIARPFVGEAPNFIRTSNRHDYSVLPPSDTMLDLILRNGFDVISVGKIVDIFANRGITKAYRTKNNDDGMNCVLALLDESFEGLCFVNLVDFDSAFGHRNDILGYTNALNHFDEQLALFLDKMSEDDVLIITADHGCDPATKSTDHSREFVPMLMVGKKVKQGVDLGTRESFADVSATVLESFGIENTLMGMSFWNEVRK